MCARVVSHRVDCSPVLYLAWSFLFPVSQLAMSPLLFDAFKFAASCSGALLARLKNAVPRITHMSCSECGPFV